MLKVLLKNKLFVSLVDIVPGSGNYKQAFPDMHVPFRSRTRPVCGADPCATGRPRPPAPNVSPAPGDEPRPSSPSPRGWCACSDGGPAPRPGQRPHGGRRQLARPGRRAGLARARLRRARGAREAGAAVGPAHGPAHGRAACSTEGKAAAQGRAAGGGSRGAPGSVGTAVRRARWVAVSSPVVTSGQACSAPALRSSRARGETAVARPEP